MFATKIVLVVYKETFLHWYVDILDASESAGHKYVCVIFSINGLAAK